MIKTMAEDEKRPLLSETEDGGQTSQEGVRYHYGGVPASVSGTNDGGQTTQKGSMPNDNAARGAASSDNALGTRSTVISPLGVNDIPPSYISTSTGATVFNCRVCQALIDISGKADQFVVKCGACTEATPIKKPPSGKKYVRCNCNCLLICNSTAQRIACPRPNCKRIINLSGSPATPQVPAVPGMCRITCAHCSDSFPFNTLNNALARCPHCRKVSSVGPDYARCKWILNASSSLFFTIIGIVLLITTLKYTSAHPAIYVAYIFTFLVALTLLYRSIYFCSMKISLIDGPV